MEHGSHLLEHEPWRQTTVIPHHLWWEYLTFKQICTKKGKNGRDWTRTNDLTDVNHVDGDHAHDVTLLEVESFNK
jgi:hypothetical protein